MHWLCTGTHSEMAVQVAGATARVGLGGIWYQWMWLFSTPFYWLIAPITRRLRVTTTGDFFRIRYGKSLEMLYALVGLFYFALSIALLLRGAGAAISGATGGAIPTHASVIVLSILFSTYVMAGGLVAAAYTDFLQGVLIIALSLLLVPAGLSVVGGISGLRAKLAPSFFAITAPQGAPEGDPWFVVTMSILGLVGVVVQPHVMTATGSGKTETEARVGMVYGNVIKRLLTIAWAFTGLIALAAFPATLAGIDPTSGHAREASETLFGQAIQHFLGDGWRGLMVACLIAGVTSAETFMVGGSALFTRNFYAHALPNRSHTHYLWVGRVAAGGSAGGGHPGGLDRCQRHAARARLGEGDRAARGGVLAGCGLEARESGGRLGELRRKPFRLGADEYSVDSRTAGRLAADHGRAGHAIRTADSRKPAHSSWRPS